MESGLAILLMTATLLWGMAHGFFSEAFSAFRKQSMLFGDITMQQKTISRPIDATFVALFSTYLPRIPGGPHPAIKRAPKRIHWVEAE